MVLSNVNVNMSMNVQRNEILRLILIHRFWHMQLDRLQHVSYQIERKMKCQWPRKGRNFRKTQMRKYVIAPGCRVHTILSIILFSVYIKRNYTSTIYYSNRPHIPIELKLFVLPGSELDRSHFGDSSEGEKLRCRIERTRQQILCT